MRAAVSFVGVLALCACRVRAVGQEVAAPAREPVVVERDGGWCWFQDPRAVVHDGVVYVGSVASGRFDAERRGDIQVTSWALDGGVRRTVELADKLQLDDHAAPALYRRHDGRWLVVYTRHGSDDLVRWRISDRPDEIVAWSPERTLHATGEQRGATYSNLWRARWSDGREVLLDLFRGDGWDPNVLVSRDDGESWTRAGRLLGGPGRPYVRYAGDGEVVHFIATEQHPRDFDDSIWAGTLRAGKVCRSDGTPVGAVGDAPAAPGDLTRVFQGGPDAVAWTVDLELDDQGRPVALYSVQVDGAGKPVGEGGLDHRFGYAWWDGEAWHASEIAHAGTRLYAGEDDYTGLGAIDPDYPYVVYLSTDADPQTGAPLISVADGKRHRELYRGETIDGGRSWTWKALTSRSTLDNLRPIVPARDANGRTALLWLRGELRKYTDYDLEIVGLELERM